MAAVSAIRFDLRRAPFSPLSDADLYRHTVEMSTWADEHGFAAITVSEHHGVDFISSPVAMAGMLLGATKSASVMINALLLPLYDPVRLAEDTATLDLMSGGRFRFVAGLGYRHEEFAMAGVDRKRRGKIVEEYLGVLMKAWTGEPFEWQGRTITVTPTPASPAQALVFAGGSVKASAERAARLRLGFFTMSTDPTLGETYEAECKKVGFEHGFFMFPTGPSFVHVAEDPDKAWAELGALRDLRRVHLQHLADRRPPQRRRPRVGQHSRRPQGVRHVGGGHPGRVHRARQADRLGSAAPAHGGHPTRARLAEHAAVRRQGAATHLTAGLTAVARQRPWRMDPRADVAATGGPRRRRGAPGACQDAT